jgi:hypothetical protein
MIVARPLRWTVCCAASLQALASTSALSAPAREALQISCIAPFATSKADTADTGSVSAMHVLPGAGVLIDAEKGLFLAGVANGLAAVELVGAPDIGRVLEMRDFDA